jgi:hypothetical protein
VTLPDDIKTDVARAVRSVRPELQGYCWFRNTLGQHALEALGIRSQLILGSLLYRAGPDALWDCLDYSSASNNAGWFKNKGTFFEPITEAGPHAIFCGHAWLEYSDQLVDFTPGDWPAHFDKLYRELPGEYRPVNWTAPPLPEFFWSDADALKQPWKAQGSPEIGQAWYGPLRIPRGTESAVRAQVALVKNQALGTVRQVLPLLERNMLALDLVERAKIHRADGGACDGQRRGISLQHDSKIPRPRRTAPTRRIQRA